MYFSIPEIRQVFVVLYFVKDIKINDYICSIIIEYWLKLIMKTMD